MSSGQNISTQPNAGASPTRSPADLFEIARSDGAASRAAGGNEGWDADDLAALWRHQLETRLARELDRSALGKIPPAIKSFGDLLRDAAPPIELLKTVKEYGKRLQDTPDSALPREIGWLLYLSA